MMSKNQIIEIIDELEDELLVVKEEYYNLCVEAELNDCSTSSGLISTLADIIREKETILNIYKQILNNPEDKIK